MDTKTIKAMLRTADPKNGATPYERNNALRMAERAMDKLGITYAGLGFSMEDAQRISNQFSVESVRPVSRSSKAGATGIQKRTFPTIYIPSWKPAKKHEPVESFEEREFARLQKIEDERWVTWSTWRRDEDQKMAEQNASNKKVMPYLIFVLVLIYAIIALIIYSQSI